MTRTTSLCSYIAHWYLFWLTHILIHPHALHRTLNNTNTHTTTFCLLTQKTHDNTSSLQYRIQEQYKRKPTLTLAIPGASCDTLPTTVWAIKWKDHLPTFDLTRGVFYPRKTEYEYAVGLSRMTQQSFQGLSLTECEQVVKSMFLSTFWQTHQNAVAPPDGSPWPPFGSGPPC